MRVRQVRTTATMMMLKARPQVLRARNAVQHARSPNLKCGNSCSPTRSSARPSGRRGERGRRSERRAAHAQMDEIATNLGRAGIAPGGSRIAIRGPPRDTETKTGVVIANTIGDGAAVRRLLQMIVGSDIAEHAHAQGRPSEEIVPLIGRRKAPGDAMHAQDRRSVEIAQITGMVEVSEERMNTTGASQPHGIGVAPLRRQAVDERLVFVIGFLPVVYTRVIRWNQLQVRPWQPGANLPPSDMDQHATAAP